MTRARDLSDRPGWEIAEIRLQSARRFVQAPPLSPKIIGSLDQLRERVHALARFYGLDSQSLELAAFVLGWALGEVAGDLRVDKETEDLITVVGWSLGIRPREDESLQISESLGP